MTPQKLDEMTEDRLIAQAREAQKQAYCRYSEFAVGAALLFDDGTIVTGCNVENASYGLTICAERTAMVRAVAEGRRELVAVAVAGPTVEPLLPCGACRQFLAEFNPTVPFVCVGTGEERLRTSLDLLLPGAIDGDAVARGRAGQ